MTRADGLAITLALVLASCGSDVNELKWSDFGDLSPDARAAARVSHVGNHSEVTLWLDRARCEKGSVSTLSSDADISVSWRDSMTLEVSVPEHLELSPAPGSRTLNHRVTCNEVVVDVVVVRREWPSAAVRSAAGCYEMKVGPWVKKPATDPPKHPIPKTIELRLVYDRYTAWLLEPSIPQLDDRFGHNPGWKLEGPFLKLYWSTGFESLDMRLRSTSDTTWFGTAETWIDVVLVDNRGRPLPRSRAPVLLTRTPCASQPKS